MENNEYVGASRVSQEVVETFPEKFVVEVCLPACKILWDKNIYTFMCSDSLNDDAWIEVILDNLSEENKQKIEEVKPLLKRLYSYHKGTLNFEVEGSDELAKEQLIKIANVFSIQDVPHNEAYLTEKDFLIMQGCYNSIPNPNYIPDPFYVENGEIDLESVHAYFESNDPTKDIKEFKTFDPEKVEKPIEQYLADESLEKMIYVKDEQRIYQSEFDYKKHLNFINSLKGENTLKR